MITEDPDIIVLWIPGMALWSAATPRHDRIVAALIRTFDPELIGAVNEVAPDDEIARSEADDGIYLESARPGPDET